MSGTDAAVMRLTVQRALRGWSKSELARRADLNPATVGAIESGRLQPYDIQLMKIALALGWPKEEAGRLLDPDSQEGRTHG